MSRFPSGSIHVPVALIAVFVTTILAITADRIVLAANISALQTRIPELQDTEAAALKRIEHLEQIHNEILTKLQTVILNQRFVQERLKVSGCATIPRQKNEMMDDPLIP
jgi:uncharacterized membrane protein (DUF106 family)